MKMWFWASSVTKSVCDFCTNHIWEFSSPASLRVMLQLQLDILGLSCMCSTCIVGNVGNYDEDMNAWFKRFSPFDI